MLILNIIISNAFFAFPPVQEEKIDSIDAQKQLMFRFSEHKIGLPDNFDIHSTNLELNIG